MIDKRSTRATLEDMKQPLAAAEARRLAREILVNGTVSFTSHCQDELAKDGKTTIDCNERRPWGCLFGG
jgi:hypothetical protein